MKKVSLAFVPGVAGASKYLTVKRKARQRRVSLTRLLLAHRVELPSNFVFSTRHRVNTCTEHRSFPVVF